MQSTRNLTKGARYAAILAAGILIVVASACKKEKRPAAVLPDEKFTALLIEVYVAEAKLLPLRLNRDSALKIYTPYETRLLEEKKISREALKETYRYYLNHPADFEKIYEVVMDSLSLRESKLQQASSKAK